MITYFPKRHACSSVTNLGHNDELVWGGLAAGAVQELSTVSGFKPMNMGKETKQKSGTAQVRQLCSVTNMHLQEPALPAKRSNRAERGEGLQCEALTENKR